MNELIKRAKDLKRAIKAQEKEIDNAALVMSIVNELDFFIENVEDEK